MDFKLVRIWPPSPMWKQARALDIPVVSMTPEKKKVHIVVGIAGPEPPERIPEVVPGRMLEDMPLVNARRCAR